MCVSQETDWLVKNLRDTYEGRCGVFIMRVLTLVITSLCVKEI